MIILQTSLFKRQFKKLTKKIQLDIEQAIKNIMTDPSLGEAKKGDLKDIFVYKLTSQNCLYLIAYTISISKIYLITLGSHENFYRDLKRHLS